MMNVSSSTSGLSPEYPLLGFLYLMPLHGYELHRRIAFHLNEIWRLPQNQTYNILKRLEKTGMIAAERHSAGSRPERTCFSLTPAGRAHFEHWLAAPSPTAARAIRMEFITRLFFAARISSELTNRILAEQRTLLETDLARLCSRRAGVPPEQPCNRLGLDLRIRQLESALSWLQEVSLTALIAPADRAEADLKELTP